MDFNSLAGKLLQEGQRLQGRDPYRVDYEQEPRIKKDGTTVPLHAGQRRVWKSEKRQIAIIAGTRSGKTSLGPYWCLREIQRCGGGSGLIVGPTYPLMDRNLIPECERAWKGMGRYVTGRRCFEFNDEGLRMLGVSEAAVYFGYAEDPESLESMRARWCWRDETGQSKFSRAAAEAIDRRLAQDQGRILDTTTPYEFNWFKSDVWDQRDDNPYLDVISYRSCDNPSFPLDEWNRQKAKLPAWKFAMMYEGEYTRPGGSIYEDWDESWGVVDPFVIPHNWKRTWGVDFGPSHTACVKIATDPETEIDYVYEEYQAGNLPSFMHVRTLKRSEPVGFSCMAVGGAPSEDSFRNEWQNAGLNVQRPIERSVEFGIDRTQAVIKNRKLRVFSTCTKVRDYLTGYSWETDDKGGFVPGKIKDKSSWHVGDALRYRNVQFAGDDQEVKVYSRLDIEEESDGFVCSLW